jgi:hypothetical protein
MNLVERLRDGLDIGFQRTEEFQLRAEAADEIERLTAELDALLVDAERFRRMRKWDGLPHAVTDTVWIEPAMEA